MNKLMDVALIEEIQGKYGEIIAQAIFDQMKQANVKDRDLQCTEVLQMSEIACRLRSIVRKEIEEYRNLEVEERILQTRLDAIKAEQEAVKEGITKKYSLYKENLAEFWHMYKSYMKKHELKNKAIKGTASKVVNYGKARDSQIKLLDKYVVASNAFKPSVKSNEASSAA